MAIWPFNRNKEQSADLPQEVQDYYQSEKRQRAGVAGLLAVGTLIATVLLALGLFFGGRWVYRAVFDNDNADTTTQTETSDTPAQAPDEAPVPEPSQASAPSPTPNTSQPAAPAPSTGTTPAATPASTQARQQDMPDTGPGDVAAIFIGTVVAAATIHYVVTKRHLA